MAIEVIEQNLKDEKDFKAKRYSEKLKEERIAKMRSQILAKIALLDEFKK